MPTGRHRLTRKRRNPALRAAVVTAPVVTLGAVGVGVTGSGALASGDLSPTSGTPDAHRAVAPTSEGTPVAETLRSQQISRSAARIAMVGREAKVASANVVRTKATRFATDTLNVRATPADDASVVTEVEPGTKLTVTGQRKGRFAEISWRGEYRWVTAQYLSEKRPADPATLGLSDAPCPDGSVEHGLTSAAVRVYRAVCHAFPAVQHYGGWDNHGEHSSGKAIDIMTSDVTLGTQIAEFLKAHASELGLYDVIWRQHIWTPVRAGEGWRSMPDRGSATANHYDHVHVSVN